MTQEQIEIIKEILEPAGYIVNDHFEDMNYLHIDNSKKKIVKLALCYIEGKEIFCINTDLGNFGYEEFKKEWHEAEVLIYQLAEGGIPVEGFG